MLLKQLSDEDKRTFLCLAELLILCDRPVLWDGKRREAITAESKSATVTIQRDEREAALVEELSLISPDKGGTMFFTFMGHGLGRRNIEPELVKRISSLPLHGEEDQAARWNVAGEVLREVLKGKQAALPSVPKLFLFELMMLSLAEGSIPSIRWQVLNEIRHHYHIESFIFDDLLERAESSHSEAQKTVAIIFE